MIGEPYVNAIFLLAVYFALLLYKYPTIWTVNGIEKDQWTRTLCASFHTGKYLTSCD